MNSIMIWSMGFYSITQQFGFLVIEVSLSLNVCMFVVCLLLFSWLLLGLYILVLPAIHEGCILHWSGNGKSIFRNKIEKFCCN